MSNRIAWRLCLPFILAIGTRPALAAISIDYRGRPAGLVVRASGPHSVRVSLLPAEAAQATGAWLQHPALIQREWSLPVLTLGTVAGQVETNVGALRVMVKAAPLAVRIQDAQGRLVQELEFAQSDGTVSFPCGEAPVLGLGEGAKQFDRRGAFYPMKSSSGAWDLRHLGSVNAVPLLIGARGWALWVMTPWGQFDLQHERGVFLPDTNAAPAFFDAIVIDAHAPENLMQAILQLAGQPVLPQSGPWATCNLTARSRIPGNSSLLPTRFARSNCSVTA